MRRLTSEYSVQHRAGSQEMLAIANKSFGRLTHPLISPFIFTGIGKKTLRFLLVNHSIPFLSPFTNWFLVLRESLTAVSQVPGRGGGEVQEGRPADSLGNKPSCFQLTCYVVSLITWSHQSPFQCLKNELTGSPNLQGNHLSSFLSFDC